MKEINATALDTIKAYTPIMGWARSDLQVSQHQQIQTPARRTVSTRRTKHTIQRQTESMDIDPGFSNTQPNNPSIPALHKPTATQHHNLPKDRRRIPTA